jgi:hypothetical protein
MISEVFISGGLQAHFSEVFILRDFRLRPGFSGCGTAGGRGTTRPHPNMAYDTIIVTICQLRLPKSTRIEGVFESIAEDRAEGNRPCEASAERRDAAQNQQERATPNSDGVILCP